VLAAVRFSTGQAPSVARFRRIEPWHTAAFVALSILPVVAVVAAKLITHAFTHRYAIAAFPGVCILLTIGFSRINHYSPAGAAALWLMLVATFGGMVVRTYLMQQDELAALRETAAFLRKPADGAIVMSDVTGFHRLSFYARRDLGSRLVYLADPDESIRYLGFDTIDRGLLDLNPWFPLNVRRLLPYVTEHSSFLIWATIGDWSWTANAMAGFDRDVRLAGVLHRSVLLMVNDAKLPRGGLSSDASGQQMMYSALPAGGKPLCQWYMPAANCPSVE
jgi:hypothetical protein